MAAHGSIRDRRRKSDGHHEQGLAGRPSMCRRAAASYRLGSSIGMFLALLMATPLAAAEEAPFDLATAVADDTGRLPYALVAPLSLSEETLLLDEGGAAGGTGGAQTAPSKPMETPIPFEVGPGYVEPWPYALPFLANDVIKRGYTLPLPRGFSLVYTYVERDVKIETIKVGVNGAPLRDVSNFVNLGSFSKVNVAVGRFDAWLLPFLNVYAMAGYVSNNTLTKGIVTIPPLLPRGQPRTFEISKTTELGGFV